MGKRPGSRNRGSVQLERRIARLAAKKTAPEIALQVGICADSVYRILRRLGIRPLSTRAQAPLAKRNRVLRLVAKLGAAGAAKKLKVSRQALYDRVARWSSEVE